MTVFRSSKQDERHYEDRHYEERHYDDRKQYDYVESESCHSDCDSTYVDSYSSSHPFDFDNDATVTQRDGDFSFLEQESAELIWVKESCDITVTSTDTQLGVSLQVALQLAIAVVIRLSIGDTDRSEQVAQELTQYLGTSQVNKQKVYIYNTKDATVTTTDTDLAINIQILLQLLVAIVIMIDIL
ncbi:spore coat protein [Oceanobacillus iheyensis]|uniref:Spore coat protein X (Insoluble fraction) n=1 Tax=Oceanobacillus iheyensis (strain DSM 14371 / CIP 107618 / JCM 11309 / KCTC 3954 / HTE831) TaxID=221109 RepID=Q8CXM5_OCEIH|nr:spore coat protein [Oceanobacillus iheyensis]BAC12530.1 spore coat protein X (insoluble fraction) [Oceanobacillus iheyensis HTE831]